MNYSKAGIRLTESGEGLRLEAYQDSGGIWTIGYGHTHGVRPGMKCTAAEAEQWLAEDTAFAVAAVNRLVKTPLNQAEFDALVDFVFNVGPGNFKSSALLRDANRGAFAEAAAEFEKWDKAGGRGIAGLLRRRKLEEERFLEIN